MKHLLPVAILALAGCSTLNDTGSSDPEIREAEAKYQECIEAQGFESIRRECTSYLLDKLDADKQAIAEQRWNEQLEKYGADGLLLDGALSGDIAQVSEALAAGADINRAWTEHELNGSDQGSPNTALYEAAMNFDKPMVRFLLESGANPNWSYQPEPGYDAVSDMAGRSQFYFTEAGEKVETHGSEIAEIFLQYGYKPSTSTLKSWRFQSESYSAEAKTVAFYEKLMTIADRATKQALAEQDAKKERDRKAKEEKERRERQAADQRLEQFTAQLKAKQAQRVQRMRHIGTKVCRVRPIRYGDMVEVGFVERLAEEKAQIRIVHAYMQGAPNLTPGGFRENITWDSLYNWQLCE